MDGIIAGSSFPIEINVAGVDLTLPNVTEIWFTVAWRPGESPIQTIPVKTKTGAAIAVTYDGPTSTSKLSLVLSDTETAGLTQDVAYAIYVDDGTPGGPWIPDNGGHGTIRVCKAAKKV